MSITERELLMLQDHLSLHTTMAEKAGFYANQVSDQEIRQTLLQIQRAHQRHVDAITGHISQNSTMISTTGSAQDYQG